MKKLFKSIKKLFKRNTDAEIKTSELVFDEELYVKMAKLLSRGDKTPRKRQGVYKLKFERVDATSVDYTIMTDIDMPDKDVVDDIYYSDNMLKCLLRLMIISFNMAVLSGRKEYADLYNDLRDILEFVGSDAGESANTHNRCVFCVKQEMLPEDLNSTISLYSTIDRLIDPSALSDKSCADTAISYIAVDDEGGIVNCSVVW